VRQLLILSVLAVVLGCASGTPDVAAGSSSVPADIKAPVLVHKVNPEYPASLRREGVTGMVTVEGRISTAGEMLDPRVTWSSDPRLEDPALAAVRQWHFRPGTVKGEPVEVLFSVDIKFSVP
jgi:protein TonB